MAKEEGFNIEIPKDLKQQLDNLSAVLGYEISTTARLILEKYRIDFEIYMDEIAFSSYKEDKRELERIFQGNPVILERLRSIHDLISSAPDEDAETEILAIHYEKFYAELYKNYKEVRELHK